MKRLLKGLAGPGMFLIAAGLFFCGPASAVDCSGCYEEALSSCGISAPLEDEGCFQEQYDGCLGYCCC